MKTSFNLRLWNFLVILSVLVLVAIPAHAIQAQDDDVPGVPIEISGQITNLSRQSYSLTLDDAVVVLFQDLGRQALAGLGIGDFVNVTGILLDDGSIAAVGIEEVESQEPTVDSVDSGGTGSGNSPNAENNGNGNSANAGNNGNGNGRGNGNSANAGNNGNGNGRGNGNGNSANAGNNGNGNGRGNGNAGNNGTGNGNGNSANAGNNGNGNGRGNGNSANAGNNGNGNGNGNGNSANAGNNGNGNGRGNTSDCGSASGRCHPVLSRLSAQLNVDYAQLETLREQGFGIGEITRGYLLAEAAGVSALDIFVLRDGGAGWGEIYALFPDVSPSDLSLGSVIGGGNGNGDD
jgi:hypothetical protein